MGGKKINKIERNTMLKCRNKNEYNNNKSSNQQYYWQSVAINELYIHTYFF